MTIQNQLDRIRAQQTIEDVGDDMARAVFRASVNAYRKWLSPVRSPAPAWIDNIKTMMIKCRLDGDAMAFAELLAVRAAAQLDGTIRSSEYDDLARGAGLDIVSVSEMAIGTGARVTIGENVNEPGSLRVDYRGIPVVIRDVAVEGHVKTDDEEEAVRAIDRLAQRATGGSRYVEVNYTVAPESEFELFDAVHDPWRPTSVYAADLKAHPTKIIEPSTLAATPYPPAVYRPLLPAEAIKRGFISDAQFETVLYGLQAVTQYLPGSPQGRGGRRTKGGFIIGDGTGVGKTNEICGIIMDQWMRDVRRHIVVVERSKHVAHFQDAWAMLGGNARDVFFQGATSANEQLPDRDGIIITTYALIRNDRRYEALLDWANDRRDMNGILAFDEAHNMRNAVEDIHEEGSGKRNQSQQGERGVELQEALPEAGVIYASATMATDVYNLGYAPRLGLWGENAPFATQRSFIAEMYLLDEAALEQICIDLKAAGRYCSRTLSFDGVEYEELVHKLTPTQRRMFDGAIKNWKTLSAMMKNATINAGGNDRYARGRLTQMKRSLVEQMLSSFNVETLIDDVHKEIALGNAPVIQIAYTGEARLQRLADGRDYIPVEEYRDEETIKWIKENFPETKLVYDKTNLRNVPKTDVNGNPIVDAQALKMKQEALRIAEELAFRNSVLDRLILEFGIDQIAEVTGRSIRSVPKMVGGQLAGWNIEPRSNAAAMDDVEAFHDGKKPILVFSLAAGGTGLGYQAAEKSRNKRRRVHYILELGRRAESAVQGLGRTHRSDQVIPPHVKLVTSDIPAHAIYSARTLVKIQKMGALSRGHQHATTNAIFEQRVPISGPYAERGWNETLKAVSAGELGEITIESIAHDLSLDTEGGNSIWSLDRAIGQLAVLTDGDQRLIVSTLIEKTEEQIAKAIRQGTYNQGMETIRADSISVVDENRIHNANGSTTTYYRLRKREEIELQPFRRVAMLLAATRAKKSARAVFMRHRVNGRIVLGVLRDGPSGIVDIYSPAGSTTRHQQALKNEPWKIVDNMADAERMWNLEAENLDTRAESDLHILSGSLLYNWNRLPKTGIGLNRCQTDDGRVIIGRVINQRELRATLASIGMQSGYNPVQIGGMLARVNKGAVLEVDNGWRIVGKQNGDYRLVVPDAEQTGALRSDLLAMGVDVQDGPLGTELVIDKSKAVEVIQSLAVGCDISLQGTTTTAQAAVAKAAFTPPLALAACTEA